jgi:glycosyltransferase involved in cell wall biosynthesis
MKIVHVLRAPVGGLFRHVRDLARGQSELGHDVGIICDSTTGGEHAVGLLKQLETYCKLGVERRPISRAPGLGDLMGAKAVIDVARSWRPDVLHGHGAKGGAYARLSGYRLGIKSFYTPHGGSLHHTSFLPIAMIYSATEKLLRSIGTGLCFVCDYERRRFDSAFGIKGKPNIVVHNGLWDEEFQPATAAVDATDFLFVGELRDFKGVDLLLHALAEIPNATLTLVGDGPQMDEYKILKRQLGIEDRARFVGRKTMAEAASMGRIMVLPSRFESFPYVVIETAAAGLPLITSNVGGIAEVVPRHLLCEPLTAEELAKRMRALLANPKQLTREAEQYSKHIRKTCSALEMSRKISEFYTTT